MGLTFVLQTHASGFVFAFAMAIADSVYEVIEEFCIVRYSDQMDIEYEATFSNIDKAKMRGLLVAAGAKLIRPDYLQRRIAFWLPGKGASEGEWLRVRDEGDKITVSLKRQEEGNHIASQKEICIEVNEFDKAVNLLEGIGCKRKSYQETKRELWTLDGVEVTIDEWPFLEPFVEVEGNSEKVVKSVAENLGFDYSDAHFSAVGNLYSMKYGVHPNEINATEKIVFDMKNPFVGGSGRSRPRRGNR